MKSFSVICYITGGLFVDAVGLMAFLDVSQIESGSEPNTFAKYFAMGIFAVPALISLLGGLYLNGFRNAERDTGVVLLSGAGMAGLVALSVLCMVLTPELKDHMHTDSLLLFGDVTSGLGCILIFALLGAFLLWSSQPAGMPFFTKWAI